MAPSITPQLHPISPLVSNNTPAPAPVARRGRGSSRVQSIQDSLQSLQSSSSAAPLVHFTLNAVMDNFMDQSVSSTQFNIIYLHDSILILSSLLLIYI